MNRSTHLLNNATGRPICGRRGAWVTDQNKSQVSCLRCKQIGHFTHKVVDGKFVVVDEVAALVLPRADAVLAKRAK